MKIPPKKMLVIRCPTCGVPPGKQCVLNSGGLRSTSHVDRRLVASEVSKVEMGVVAQFNEYSFNNPNLNFEQVSLKELGKNPFLKTLNGKKFKLECRQVFDLERKKKHAREKQHRPDGRTT